LRSYCIILVGIKHSGKSKIAEAFRNHGYIVHDTDKEVLGKHGYKKIDAMYHDLGRGEFRKREYALLQEVLQKSISGGNATRHSIIACGGGICAYRPSRKTLAQCKKNAYHDAKKTTVVVHLKTSPEAAMRRFDRATLPAFLQKRTHPYRTWQKMARKRLRKYNSLASFEVASQQFTPIIEQPPALRKKLLACLNDQGIPVHAPRAAQSRKNNSARSRKNNTTRSHRNNSAHSRSNNSNRRQKVGR